MSLVAMEENIAQNQTSGSIARRRIESGNFSFRKRTAPKFPSRENDVFINNKSNFKAQLNRCEKLFDDGYTEIIIHGLGAAISTAVNVALMLQDKLSNTVDISVNTSTVDLLDDFFPLTDDERPFSDMRSNSAVHIKINRKPNF